MSEQVSTRIDARRIVVANERKWHEEEAHRRHFLDTLLYDPPAFEDVIASGIQFLKARQGQRILDLGCGEGKETLALAQQGLRVVGTDLSRQQLLRTQARLRAHGLAENVYLVQANAEELPFRAQVAPLVYGKAVIHHLDPDLSAGEIGRVLQPGGKATFAEPLSRHPLFWLARRLTPRLRTQDEHPFSGTELESFGARFQTCEPEYFYLLSPVAYVVRLLPGGESLFARLHRFLRKIDRRLLQRFPILRRWAWYGAVHVRK